MKSNFCDCMRQEACFGITITVIFILGFALGSFVESPEVFFDGKIRETCVQAPAQLETETLSESETKLVAVDSKGNGILTDLSVRAVPGDGKLLVDVDNLLFWIDTQQSIQTAKSVAEHYLDRRADNVDLTYTIKVSGTSVVGGPSAGAAFAAATIAALDNKTLRNDVVITGTIEENGTIGPVGGVVAKGMAAKEGGYGLFLVPDGEKNLLEYRKETECETFGRTRICTIKYIPVDVDIAEEIGIEVIEVSDIGEAMEYLL